MQAFENFTGEVAPLDRTNVDTDAIIPKQYLKSIQRTGFGRYLFDDWRYLDPGDLDTDVAQRRSNPDFVLNQSRYSDASILAANENFGCGSSREHAVWALDDYGFKVVIAPSFADIFFNNAFKNGLLPIVLEKQWVEKILHGAARENDYRLTIDLEAQTVTLPDGTDLAFKVDEFRKQSLLKGLDDIGHTLEQADVIRAYEARRRREAPWLFAAK